MLDHEFIPAEETDSRRLLIMLHGLGDSAAGYDWMPAALQLSDHILLVANPDVPCLRNLQRLMDAVKTAGVPGERLQIVLNRASESGVLSTAQIERVLGLNINFSVNSDYRTVASAVNSGVPVSTLRASDIIGQLDAIARSIVGFPDAARPKSGIRQAAQADQRRAEV